MNTMINDMIKQVILAFFGSVFPVILFNIERKKIIWTGFCGAIGWATYLIIYNVCDSSIIASFVGAFAVGIYSEIMARILKTPATQFSIPGIFPLVPGILGYRTISLLVEKELREAAIRGVETIAIAAAIGFGIMLSATTSKFISRLKNGKNSSLT